MTDTFAKSQGSAALRLLQGIAAELRDLAEDTAKFGETLSRDTTICSTSETVGLLQRFDHFTQSLRGHALLIGDLSTHLDANAEDVSALGDIIGQMPFFGVRERLRAQMDGAIARSPEVGGKSVDEEWF